MNMVIGAAQHGLSRHVRHSGGGFALMTEAIGMAGMIETPLVCVDVQRAGPATGVPTTTEQGESVAGAGSGQGDYPRIIVAPASQTDLFRTIPELFNLATNTMPGLVLADLLISEGTSSIDPAELEFQPTSSAENLSCPTAMGTVTQRIPLAALTTNAYLRY